MSATTDAAIGRRFRQFLARLASLVLGATTDKHRALAGIADRSHFRSLDQTGRYFPKNIPISLVRGAWSKNMFFGTSPAFLLDQQQGLLEDLLELKLQQALLLEGKSLALQAGPKNYSCAGYFRFRNPASKYYMDPADAAASTKLAHLDQDLHAVSGLLKKKATYLVAPSSLQKALHSEGMVKLAEAGHLEALDIEEVLSVREEGKDPRFSATVAAKLQKKHKTRFTPQPIAFTPGRFESVRPGELLTSEQVQRKMWEEMEDPIQARKVRVLLEARMEGVVLVVRATTRRKTEVLGEVSRLNVPVKGDRPCCKSLTVSASTEPR